MITQKRKDELLQKNAGIENAIRRYIDSGGTEEAAQDLTIAFLDALDENQPELYEIAGEPVNIIQQGYGAKHCQYREDADAVSAESLYEPRAEEPKGIESEGKGPH